MPASHDAAARRVQDAVLEGDVVFRLEIFEGLTFYGSTANMTTFVLSPDGD